jgi:hypothetical protein
LPPHKPPQQRLIDPTCASPPLSNCGFRVRKKTGRTICQKPDGFVRQRHPGRPVSCGGSRARARRAPPGG